jgi:hypothetical protein
VPSIDRGFGPLRPISWTASEIMARQIVKRLFQQPPRGLSWKDFAVREIARNLNAFRPSAHQLAADTVGRERPTPVIAALARA